MAIGKEKHTEWLPGQDGIAFRNSKLPKNPNCIIYVNNGGGGKREPDGLVGAHGDLPQGPSDTRRVIHDDASDFQE